MGHFDTEPALSEAFHIPSQLSSQIISSAAPSVSASRTRNRPLRKGVILPKKSTQAQIPLPQPTQRDIDDYRPLEDIPTSIEERLDDTPHF